MFLLWSNTLSALVVCSILFLSCCDITLIIDFTDTNTADLRGKLIDYCQTVVTSFICTFDRYVGVCSECNPSTAVLCHRHNICTAPLLCHRHNICTTPLLYHRHNICTAPLQNFSHATCCAMCVSISTSGVLME